MVKVVGYAVALGLLVAALLVPAWVLWDDDASVAAARAAAGDPDPTAITGYDATFELGTDGDLLVEEQLTVELPPYDARTGITRYFDRVDGSDEGARRRVRAVSATLDGERATVSLTTSGHGRFDVATVGGPGTTVEPGEHRVVLRYRVRDVLEPGYDGAAASLHWDLVPSSWTQDIAAARLTVRLPSPALGVQCGIGRGDNPLACDDVTGQNTTTVVVRTGRLPAHTPVRVRIGVAEAPSDTGQLPWKPRYDVVLGQSVRLLGLVLGGAVLAGLLGLLFAHRARGRLVPAVLVVAGVAVVAAAAAAVWNPLDMSVTGLVPGAFAVAVAPLLRPAGRTRRTPAAPPGADAQGAEDAELAPTASGGRRRQRGSRRRVRRS